MSKNPIIKQHALFSSKVMNGDSVSWKYFREIEKGTLYYSLAKLKAAQRDFIKIFIRDF